jgi:hypothetical protein
MKHYNKNKENEEYQDKVKGYRDKYRQSETFQQYRENRKQDEEVKERKRIADREWRANNAEKVKEQAKRNYTTYYAKHKDTEEYKERRKKNRSKPEIKEKRNKTQNDKRNTDIIVSLRDNISRRINKALKNVNSVKSDKTVEYLGCSMVDFVKHIEKQFKEGMTWDNYGRRSVGNNKHWEVDHIIPINYEKPSFEDVKERLVYTNCQPMWAEENRSKSNRYIG